MTTYNTGNPIGSANVKDLYDNAENLDTAVNVTTPGWWVDRLGVQRPNIAMTLQIAATGQVNTFYAPTRQAAEILAAELGDGATVWIDSDDANGGVRTRNTVVDEVLTDAVPLTSQAVQFRRGTTGSFRSVYSKLTDMTTVTDFGAVGDGVTDDTAAFTAAIAVSKAVFVPFRSNGYAVSTIDLNRGDCVLICAPGVQIKGRYTASGQATILLSADYASVHDGYVLGYVDGTYGYRTTGFRNTLFNCTATGTTLNPLRVSGLETTVIIGRYRGGSGAGIYVGQPDLYLANVYTEQNQDGIYSDGIGSITAHHVHSFKNSRHGFNLIGASFSQLTGCYADTNGRNGYEIRDTTNGLTLTDCWGYKSSNVDATYSDFFFYNAKGVTLVGCRASGTGGASKRGTFTTSESSTVPCQIAFIGCYSSGAVDIGTPRFHTFSGCQGLLKNYNRPDCTTQSGAVTATASGGTGTFTLQMPFVDGNIIEPGINCFEVTLSWRNSGGGSNTGMSKCMVAIAAGSGVTSSLTQIAPASPSVISSGYSFSLNATNGFWELSFTATNNNAYNVQVAAVVEYKGSGRGYS